MNDYGVIVIGGGSPSGDGCAECLASPKGWWFHLRRCAECGHIGCCDSLAASNIAITYSDNRSLLNPQKMNLSPRFGFAYQPVNKFVVRGAFGIYYNARENLGDFVDRGINYPYDIEQSFPNPTCALNNCPSNGIHLATGIPAGNPGLSNPTVTGWQQNQQTEYTSGQNLTVEYAIDNHTSFTLGYVGTEARHLPIIEFGDNSVARLPPGVNYQPCEPRPALAGNVRLIADNAIANYNSLQAKLERHFAHGLSFLSSYTWSHTLDDDRSLCLTTTKAATSIPISSAPESIIPTRHSMCGSDLFLPAPMTCHSGKDAHG